MGEFSDAVSITAISTKAKADEPEKFVCFRFGGDVKVIETKSRVPEKYCTANFLGKGGTAERSYGNCLQFLTSSRAADDAPPSPPTASWANTFFFSGGFAVKVWL